MHLAMCEAEGVSTKGLLAMQDRLNPEVWELTGNMQS